MYIYNYQDIVCYQGTNLQTRVLRPFTSASFKRKNSVPEKLENAHDQF